MKIDGILSNIKTSFSKMPDGVMQEIISSNQKELYDIFANKAWNEIEHERLFFTEDSLRGLSDKAFSYYIAAYLKLLLTDYYRADALVDCIIDMLTPPSKDGNVRLNWINKKFFYLMDNQKNCISATLRFLADEYQDVGAIRALDIYWDTYLLASNDPDGES